MKIMWFWLALTRPWLLFISGRASAKREPRSEVISWRLWDWSWPTSKICSVASAWARAEVVHPLPEFSSQAANCMATATIVLSSWIDEMFVQDALIGFKTIKVLFGELLLEKNPTLFIRMIFTNWCCGFFARRKWNWNWNFWSSGKCPSSWGTD